MTPEAESIGLDHWFYTLEDEVFKMLQANKPWFIRVFSWIQRHV